MSHMLGGKVAKSAKREYGRAELIIDDDSDLLKSISAIRRKGERPFALPTPTPYPLHSRLDVSWRQDRETAQRIHSHRSHKQLACCCNGGQEQEVLRLQFHPEVAYVEDKIP